MIFLLLFFQIILCQEIELNRIIFKEINFTEQVQPLNENSCQQNQCNFDQGYDGQFDMLFTMKINFTKSNQEFEMFIDLVNPLSWYKSPDCEFQDLLSTNQSKSCFDRNNNKYLQSEDKFSIEKSIKAYNASMKGYLVLPSIVTYDQIIQLQMLQINKIVGKKPYPSDGAISFSRFIDFNQQDFIIEYSHNKDPFIEFDIANQRSKITFRQNIENKQNYELKWIDNCDTSQLQWKFKVTQISFLNKQLIQDDLNYEAILILNSQFISLPYELCIQFIEKLISYDNSISCYYADSEVFAIICKNLGKSIKNSLNLILTTSNSNVNIKLSNLIGTCKKDICLLKIRVSISNVIFLGEPFFNQNQHQIILKYLTGQIGIYVEKPDQNSKNTLSFENLAIWMIGMTLFLSLMFCLMNFKHAVKWCVITIKYRKTQNLDDELKLRSQEVEFNEIEKVEQMTQSIEENSI